MTGFRLLARVAILAFAGGIASQSAASERECLRPSANELLAQVRFADGIVAFQIDDAPGAGPEIDLLYYEAGDWCEPVAVDRYEIEGGDPRLEASFVYPIQGQPNLFAIVSWPRLHVGIDMRGRQYSVLAYHQSGGGLEQNRFVADNPAVSEGFVGTIDGTEYTFEGTTEEGLIALMGSLGKWSWQAACNPAGQQHELNACAYVAQLEAEEELDRVREEFSSLYEEDEELRVEMLARFDDVQSLWLRQLQNDLDALFPLPPGEDPSIVHGSSYPMQYSYARALLIQHRTEFLRAFWLPKQEAAEPSP